jgi:hypothetical protein
VTDHNPSAPPFQLPAPPLTPWLSVSPQASRREADEAAAKEAKEVAAKAAEVRLPTSLHTPQPGCAWDVGTAAS